MESTNIIMSDTWSNPSMLLVKSNWAQMPSFSLIPINKDCPYVEAMFNPHAKVLAIIGKTKKEAFHKVPRLDDNGEPLEKKGPKKDPNSPYRMQRVSQETYTEYYITEKSDIESFIKAFTVNHESFDWQESLNMETMDAPDTSKVMKPSLIIEK